MSHTIRNEQTKGWLDRLEHQRRERKQARALKADPSFFEEDILPDYLVAEM